MSSVPVQPQEDCLPDVVELVRRGMDYTDSLGWLTWAWGALSRTGRVPIAVDDRDENYVDHVITMCVLGWVYSDFQDVATGLDGGGASQAEVVGHVRPQVTEIELGRYCERNGIYDLGFPESCEGLLREAMALKSRSVMVALREGLGLARLFTSLVIAGEGRLMWSSDGGDEDDEVDTPESAFPLAPDAFDEHMDAVVNTGIDSGDARAYEWLEQVTLAGR